MQVIFPIKMYFPLLFYALLPCLFFLSVFFLFSCSDISFFTGSLLQINPAHFSFFYFSVKSREALASDGVFSLILLKSSFLPRSLHYSPGKGFWDIKKSRYKSCDSCRPCLFHPLLNLIRAWSFPKSQLRHIQIVSFLIPDQNTLCIHWRASCRMSISLSKVSFPHIQIL